jgi:hypothetical protein
MNSIAIYLYYLVILFVGYILWKLFYPLLVAIKYKIKYKEQIVIRFLPFLGSFGLNLISEKMYGDNMKWIRNVTDKYPKVKIIMTNFLFFPEMYIIDCEYSR